MELFRPPNFNVKLVSMKTSIRSVLVSCFVLLLQQSSAQTIPNASFEYWRNSNAPNDWFTIAMLPGQLYQSKLVTQEITQSHTGLSCAKLSVDTFISITPSLNIDTAIGMLSLGEIVESPPGSGLFEALRIPFTAMPDSLVFYYQYAPVGLDTLQMEAKFYAGMNMVAGKVVNFAQAQTTWSRFSMPFNYSSTPSEALLSFSGKQLVPHPNTALWIDDIAYIYNTPVSVHDFEKNKLDFMVYPNPSSGSEVSVKFKSNQINHQIQVINELGQQVSAEILLLQKEDNMYTYKIIVPSSMSSGQYLIKVNKGGSYDQTFRWHIVR